LSKYGTKRYDKVNQRTGRLKQKYPSVQRIQYRIGKEHKRYMYLHEMGNHP
jgi:hypothetical protein